MPELPDRDFEDTARLLPQALAELILHKTIKVYSDGSTKPCEIVELVNTLSRSAAISMHT
jgi:hypothetical protein